MSRPETNDEAAPKGAQDKGAKGVLGQPVTLGVIALIVVMGVFRVVVWPKVRNWLGLGVSCLLREGQLVCRLSGASDKVVRYCWQMTLRCQGQPARAKVKSCRVVPRGQNLELRFPAADLKRHGCAAPLGVEVSDVEREELIL